MLVRVLGPVRAERSDGTAVPLRPMERRLLAALVVLRPDVASADVLADALWPGGVPPSARKTVQTNVLRVRRAMGGGAIETEPEGYRLGRDVAVDIDELEPGRPPSAVGRIANGTAVGTGDPLVDLDGWPRAAPLRARLVELLGSTERARLNQMVDRQDPRAIAACEAFVVASPLDEIGWCLLIRALDDAGRTPEALRAWERARLTFVEELGVSPGPELVRLLDAILVAPTSEDAGRTARPSGEEARRRAEAAIHRSGSGWQTGLDATDPVVLELEAALTDLPPGPTPLRSQVLARWAVACSHHRPMAEVVAAARTSHAIAVALESPELLADATHSLAVVLADPALDAERRHRAQVLLDLAATHERPEWREWAVPVLARSECFAGHIDRAVALLGELDGPDADLLTASVRGDWAAARAAASELRERAVERLFDPNAALLQEMGMLGIIALHEGTAVAAGPADLEWPVESMAWSVRAWTAASHARLGQLDRARAVLDDMDPTALADVEHDAYFLPTQAMLADAVHLVGHRTIAEVVAAQLDPFLGATIVDPGLLYRGAVDHAAGLAAAVCGRHTQAGDLLTSGAETHRSHGSSWMLRRSDEALATASGASNRGGP